MLPNSLPPVMLALPYSYMANSILQTAVSKQDDVYVNKQNKIFSPFFLKKKKSEQTHTCFQLGKINISVGGKKKKQPKTPKLHFKNKQTDFKKLKLKAKVEIMIIFVKKNFNVEFLFCRTPV